jgi:hypothetical protein
MFRNARSPAPLRFIKFTLLATGQPYTELNARALISFRVQMAFLYFHKLRIYIRILRQLGKGLPHIVCQNVLSMSGRRNLSARDD